MTTATTPAPGFKTVLIPLLVLFFFCAAVLVITDHYTRDKITKNMRDVELRTIDAVMPLPHDNDLHEDYIAINDPAYFGGNQEVTVYRARLGRQPAGVVFTPVTATGYSGKILLAVGIADDGTLLGIRVIAHKETAGIGDRIEHTKSDWITNFTGRSFANTPPDAWAVRVDGGTFDQLSGATSTSRGVINAVRKVLDYFQANRDRLYLEYNPESPP